MDAIAHQQEFDAEVARLIGQVGMVCPSCGYLPGCLDEPRCPECGRAITLRQVGEYGTTAETETALRLHGPIACGACGERIVEAVEAACPACRTRIKLSWFAAYARGPRGFPGAMRAAVITGAAGVVSNVVPAAILVASGLAPLVLLPVGLCAGWLWWVRRIRIGSSSPPAWVVAAAPWVWAPALGLTALLSLRS